jgi:hypothetical protein
MSHALCGVCKEDLNDVASPCPTKLWALTDKKLDGADLGDGYCVSLVLDLDDDVTEVWVCTNCGSMGVYLDKLFHWFKPIEDSFRLLEALKER